MSVTQVPKKKLCVTLSKSSFHLPEDLITEILLRLPVKSLVRFTVVCKAWCTLIENREFVSMHLKLNPNPDLNCLLVTRSELENKPDILEYNMSLHSDNAIDSNVNTIDFPFLGERDTLAIIGVCNGLVCISYSLFEFDIVICNPSTRRFSKIPNFDALGDECLLNGEPAYGFTFDRCSDDYKFINLTRYVDTELRAKAGVYTMSTDSWREIDIVVPIDEDLRMHVCSPSALINRVFYWQGYKYPSNNAALLSFNLIDESFRVISAPEGFNGLWDAAYWKPVQLKEEVAIFAFTGRRCFVVWTLNANLVGWNLKYVIDTMPPVAIPSGLQEVGAIQLVGRGKNGDVIFEDRTLCDVKLFSYDFESGEIKRYSFGREIGYDYKVIGYTESLVPVKKSDQV